MPDTMFRLKAEDGAVLCVRHWPAGPPASAVLVIVHGMGEYGGRYAPFASFMADRGVHAYAVDLRGHGDTAAESGAARGHFADENGWALVVGDVALAVDDARRRHPDLPVFLFGHSMGSLIVRTYMHHRGEKLAGAIHSAASKPQGVLARLGAVLAGREIRRAGPRGASPALARLLTGHFNRRIPAARTPFDWLTRDEAEVDRYLADGRIVKSFTAAFYRDMIGGALEAGRKASMAKTPAQLPLLFISGGQDPLGGYGAGVRKTARAYEKAGVRDVTVILYPDARHELFQEKERKQAMLDIWHWMSKRLQA